MSLLRNIVIVALLICVAYNGYLIYRNQTTVAQAEPEEERTDAPLFSSEAFTTLAGNRSQVSVQQAPTVVMPTERVSSAQPVSNPVLGTPSETQANVAIVSAESPGLVSEEAPRDVAASSTTAANTAVPGTTTASTPVKASENDAIEPGTSRFTSPETAEVAPVAEAESGASFAQAWEAVEAAAGDFRLAEALRKIRELAQRSDLSEEQHRQVIDKGEELAKTVVHSASKHLALPALTFLPGSTLEQVAERHALPVSFLRAINGWQGEEGPTPGDSIKVLQGPIALHVDLPRSGILVSVGELYAGWISIDKNEVQVPAESSLILSSTQDAPQLALGNVAVVPSDSQEEPTPNSIGVATRDWQQLSHLAADSTSVTWAAEVSSNEELAEVTPAPEAPSDEVSQPVPAPEVVMQPVDALKLEVFTPVGKAIQGHLVRYGLQVSNLSERDSDLVQVVVNLSEGVEPVEVEGQPGRVEVGQAIFDPLTIPAGESVRLTVVVDTLQAGHHVVRPELQCARPATKYATEVQLQVVAAESVSTESRSAESESEQRESDASGKAQAMAEAPQNPAEKKR